jgi:transposase
MAHRRRGFYEDRGARTSILAGARHPETGYVDADRSDRSQKPLADGAGHTLFYDRSGFWLMMKRLEADRFAWPRGQQQAVVRLSTEQLHWLLDGIDIEAVRRHPARQYLSVG